MSKSARWALVVSAVAVLGAALVLAFVLSLSTTGWLAERHFVWLFWVNVAVAGAAAAGDRPGHAAPGHAAQARQVRQPAAGQAGRRVCAGGRGAGAADLRCVLPVCHPQHRHLVRRAGGAGAGCRPVAGPQHAGRGGGRPVRPGPHRCRAPGRRAPAGRAHGRRQAADRPAGTGAHPPATGCARCRAAGRQRPGAGQRRRQQRGPGARAARRSAAAPGPAAAQRGRARGPGRRAPARRARPAPGCARWPWCPTPTSTWRPPTKSAS